MSRVLMLDLNEADARQQCETRGIGISAIEKLPDGGVRLVCMGGEGAALLRRRLKSHLINEPVRRTKLGMARSPLEGWAR
jgi:hypothetical protein